MKLLRVLTMVAGLTGFAVGAPAAGQFFPQAQVPQPPPPDEPPPQPPMNGPIAQPSEPAPTFAGPREVATEPQSLARQVADLQREVSTLQTIVADLQGRLTSKGIRNAVDYQGDVMFNNSPDKRLYCQMDLLSMEKMFSWIHEHEIAKNNLNVRAAELRGWIPVYHTCFDRRDNSRIPEPTPSEN